jgi:predicted nucleotidyltransferase
MAETKIYIPDKLDGFLRERAMKRFGYGKGSISKSAEEAITQWLMREDLIATTCDRIVAIAKEDKNVLAVMIFGSYARKEPNYRDVDIAIVMEDGKAAEKNSGRLLPYAKDTAGLFELSIFNTLPLNVQIRALNEAVLLYVSDKGRFYDLTASVARAWNDFRPSFNVLLNG